MPDSLELKIAAIERQFRDLKMILIGMGIAGAGLGFWITKVNSTAQKAAAAATSASELIHAARDNAIAQVDSAADAARGRVDGAADEAVRTAIDAQMSDFVQRAEASDLVRSEALEDVRSAISALQEVGVDLSVTFEDEVSTGRTSEASPEVVVRLGRSVEGTMRRVCFLAGVNGRLNGQREGVEVELGSAGFWRIRAHQNPDSDNAVQGTARCVVIALTS